MRLSILAVLMTSACASTYVPPGKQFAQRMEAFPAGTDIITVMSAGGSLVQSSPRGSRTIQVYSAGTYDCVVSVSGNRTDAPASCSENVDRAEAQHRQSQRDQAELWDSVADGFRDIPSVGDVALSHQITPAPASAPALQCGPRSSPPWAPRGCANWCMNGQWVEVCH